MNARHRVIQVHEEGFVPDLRLSPNSRLHWRRKASIKAAEQDAWAWLLKRRAITPISGPVGVRWRISWGDRRSRDPDNIIGALKPYLDVLGPWHETRAPYGLDLIDGDDSSVIREYSVELVEDSKPWTALRIEAWSEE